MTETIAGCENSIHVLKNGNVKPIYLLVTNEQVRKLHLMTNIHQFLPR